MKFPISREKLHSIKKDVEEYIIEYSIENIIDKIKVAIITHAYSGTLSHLGGISKTKLRIDTSSLGISIPNNFLRHFTMVPIHFNPWKSHFEVIKGKLTELFPGVTFEIDPLNTYILIDWS
jgi:hypothetical protein